MHLGEYIVLGYKTGPLRLSLKFSLFFISCECVDFKTYFNNSGAGTAQSSIQSGQN